MGGAVSFWPAVIYGACLGDGTTLGLTLKQIGLGIKAERLMIVKQITSEFEANGTRLSF